MTTLLTMPIEVAVFGAVIWGLLALGVWYMNG